MEALSARRARLSRSHPPAALADAAYLLDYSAALVALEMLDDFALDGGLWQSAWGGMCGEWPGLSLDEFNTVHSRLAERGLIDEDWRHSRFGDESIFTMVSARGRAILDRAEAADAEHHGKLTLEDLWTHDVLLVEGPLPRDRWRQIAEAPSKGGYPTDFETSAARLLGRLYVERREDGTYASLRPPMVEPEAFS